MNGGETRRARLILLAIFWFPIALGVSAKVLFGLGGGYLLSEAITFENYQGKPAVEAGRLHVPFSRSVHWGFAQPGEPPLDIRLSVDFVWMAQVYFSVFDGAELYLAYDEVKEYVGKGPVDVCLRIADGKLTLRQVGTRDFDRSVEIPSGAVRGLNIRSQRSDFFVESMTLTVDGKGVVERQNFGPDFTLVNVVLWAMAIWFVLFGMMLAEAYFFEKRGSFVFGNTFALFAASVVPALVCLLLLRFSDFISVSQGMLGGTLLLHGVLLFLFGPREKRKWVDISDYLVFVLLLAAFTFFIDRAARGYEEIYARHVRSFFLVATWVSIALLFLLGWLLRREKSYRPISFVSSLLVYGLFGCAVLFALADSGALGEIAPTLLAGFVIYLLLILRKYVRRIRLHALLSILLFVFSVAAVESAMSRAPYANRFKPMNVGEEFKPADALFWAPQSLFVKTDKTEVMADLQVEKVNFRSGPIEQKKAPHTYRILCLGGSNTYGQWIDDYIDVWTARLGRLLDKTDPSVRHEVVNCGVKSYNLFQLLVLYKLYLADYDWDMIVLYVKFNDMGTSHKKGLFSYRELFELQNAGQWNVVDEAIAQREGRSDSRLARGVVALQKRLRKYTIYNALTKALVSLRRTDDAEEKFDLGLLKPINPPEDFRRNLLEFVAEGKKRNIRLVLGEEFVVGDNGQAYKQNSYRMEMAEVAKQTGTPLLPVQDIFNREYEWKELIFPWDPVHLNMNGQEALAKEWAKFLVPLIGH